jgi:dimeric dUTPase (all-alpha-NTP-PPase superfamily)
MSRSGRFVNGLKTGRKLNRGIRSISRSIISEGGMGAEITEDVVHEIAGLILNMTAIYQYNTTNTIVSEQPGLEEYIQRLHVNADGFNHELTETARERVASLENSLECAPGVFGELKSLIDKAVSGEQYDEAMSNYMLSRRMVNYGVN